MMLNVITRCTRPHNLLEIAPSIQSDSRLRWKIIFDTSRISKVDASILDKLDNLNTEIYFWRGEKGDFGHGLINRAVDSLQDEDWFYVLDDDNEIHPEMVNELEIAISSSPEMEGFIFSQYVGGKDFSGLEIRHALPENVRVQHIDMAQFVLKKALLGERRLEPFKYVADGVLIENLYRDFPSKFILIDKVLCYYNSILYKDRGASRTLPRVLTLGDMGELKSLKTFDFESDQLCVRISDDDRIVSDINDFDPDCIVTSGEDYSKNVNLCRLSYDFRKKWIHATDTSRLGEMSYVASMHGILTYDGEPLVSIFTPFFNTGEKLRRTYDSVRNQTYRNWEWVLVNDSEDPTTLKIAEDLASSDPRIKIYNLDKKSGGIIGESKYRACALSRGKYLIELDHDDFLLPDALEIMLKAFREFPDAGFVYSDCAEIDENMNSLLYGDGFAFGYGKYSEEHHLGRSFQVAFAPNINPKTIRHIVGVPNHFRAWERSTYFQVGGHNRRLSIADDYELLIRTFLVSKFVKIPRCCYLQFFHGGNSQDQSRADIQRRVRTISLHYNEAIKKRFEDLGKIDWAYLHGNLGWGVPSRFGDDEGFVNYTLSL